MRFTSMPQHAPLSLRGVQNALVFNFGDQAKSTDSILWWASTGFGRAFTRNPHSEGDPIIGVMFEGDSKTILGIPLSKVHDTLRARFAPAT